MLTLEVPMKRPLEHWRAAAPTRACRLPRDRPLVTAVRSSGAGRDEAKRRPLWRRYIVGFAHGGILGLAVAPGLLAATPGLPFTENFAASNLQDASNTTANWSTEQQALLLAFRQARYGAFATATTVGVEFPGGRRETVEWALGDVDGDGDTDLVAANSPKPIVLYLNNGGAFDAGTEIIDEINPGGNSTRSVALGDVDGDGDLDLVAANRPGQAKRLYLYDAVTGAFDGGTNIGLDTDSTQSVVLGDVDGDGDLDLVAGNVNQPNVLYLNLSNGFGPGTDIAIDADDTRAVGLGDVDDDGDLDLVAGNVGFDRIYLNTSGTFGPGTALPDEGDVTHGVALGDVDGDGDLDLVTGNFGVRNRLYLNDGGMFAVGSDITADAQDTVAVALGDVDGDGDLDLVAGNNGNGGGETNRLYLNNGTASPFDPTTGADITADSHTTRAVALADVDDDGDLDLLAGNDNDPNRLYLNNPVPDPFFGVAGIDVAAQGFRALAAGDVDRDGHLDLVVGDIAGPNRLYLNDGVGDPFDTVPGTDITADLGSTFTVALGDVNGDGHLDVIAGNSGQPNRLYLNDGSGDPFDTLTTGTSITADADTTISVALADMNRDGRLDVVAGNFPGANRLYVNDGAGDPFDTLITGTPITGDDDDTQSIAVGDLDRDGHLDVVAGNYSGRNRLYLSDGVGDPFDTVTGADITTDDQVTTSIALGDLDRDGDLDLVAGNLGQANRAYINDGVGDPFDTLVEGTDISADTDITKGIALGDLDRDGDLDVVVANGASPIPTEPNRLYLNDGVGDPFDTASGFDVSADSDTTSAVVLADLDRDGDLDVVASNHGSLSRLYLNGSTPAPIAGLSDNTQRFGGNTTISAALGDMDGDGDLD